MAFIARVHDTHANLWNGLDVRPPTGECEIPVIMRFVENRAVVAGYTNAETGQSTGLKAGDVIDSLDGTSVDELVGRWAPYYAASNEPTRLRDIANSMTRGDCGPATLEIRRENQLLRVATTRVAPGEADGQPRWHDLPGEPFRKLSNDVGVSEDFIGEVGRRRQVCRIRKGHERLDYRYPQLPVRFSVIHARPFTDRKTDRICALHDSRSRQSGAFHWGAPVSVPPRQPHYERKVVILIDEVTQSSAEYHSMAFRTAPGAIVVGSTTAGADGDVSSIPLPGGLRTMISGKGVFYPDKRPTQRVGIIPDVEVKPTIAGIRAGRDEVLEEAIRQILGPGAPATEMVERARQ